MSTDQSKQSPVEDVADLEVQESDEVVGGDFHITKPVDKSTPILAQSLSTPPPKA